MYACNCESERGFLEGCAIRKIGIHFSSPTPTLPFADGSASTQRVRWFSAQRIFIHYSSILCPAISPRVENSHYPRTGVELCRMLNMDFGEFTFLRPWVNKGAQGPEGSPPAKLRRCHIHQPVYTEVRTRS
jgi:hypothetical protein